jgi:threonine synthase
VSAETVVGLKCRLCGKHYPKEALNFCTDDFGPLEVAYDYDEVSRTLTRAAISARSRSMWRYRELLPLDGEPTVGRQVGCTPLIRADRLARALGVAELYIKNDAVNYPTLSFKDRVVAVALSKAVELGFQTVGCASTGNLANSVAANAAAVGLEAYVLIPDNLEQGKVLGATIYGAKVIAIHGNYDQVNRLCSQIAFRFGWGFVNVNLRPFYAEGSKTVGYEIAEDLGWRVPDHVVAPMAGGSLIGKIHKAFKEFDRLGLIDGPVTTRIHGAQASGCNPISAAVKTGATKVKPVRNPQTIAKSLAIGDPADGYFASQLIRETGGWSEDVDDDAIVAAMRLLAETEGIWTETAGGVTLAVAQKLIELGRIDRDESIVVCITGNGLKTQEPLLERMAKPVVIKPTLEEFEAVLETLAPASALVAV